MRPILVPVLELIFVADSMMSTEPELRQIHFDVWCVSDRHGCLDYRKVVLPHGITDARLGFEYWVGGCNKARAMARFIPAVSAQR